MAEARDQPPAAPWRIALADLDYGPEEEAATLRVLRSKWLSMGAEVKAFEEEFARALGAPHAIAVANATDALLLSLLALGLGPGDEVIQPAVNFVAAANMTLRAGATPVFADICSLEEPTIAPEAIEASITPRTRAVIVMHYGGAPARMDEILALARRHNLALIEDACHGVGGAYHGKAMGTLSDASAFSFFSNKNLATGEGGMIVTTRDDLAADLRALRSHGMTTLTWERHRGHAATYDVTRHGLNARMDELHAALGREQLRKLPRNNQRRRALAREYHRLVREEFPRLLQRGWLFPPLGVAGDEASHHLLVTLAPTPAAREQAMACLKAEGIQTSIHYPFIPGFSAFLAYDTAPLALSREFCSRVLTLPLHPLLTPAELRQVIAALASAAS